MRRQRLRSQRAQTAVEFAIVCQIFFLVIFAIYQFGAAYFDDLTLQQATRDGARKAQVSGSLPSTQIIAAAKQAVMDTADHLNDSVLADDNNLRVWSADNPQNADGTLWGEGDLVTVEARYPWRISLFGLVVASGWWNAKTTVRME